MGATIDNVQQLRESALADFGELAGPVTHEVNNLLNNLLLQLALWQQTGSDESIVQVQALRQRIHHTAGVVHRFQRWRHNMQSELIPFDLNAQLRGAAEKLQAAPLVLELDPALPPVLGNAGDGQRLCRFLLANALRTTPPGRAAVVARTLCAEPGIVLQVEDAGPDVTAGELPQLFDPGHEQREGMCCLELAACAAIVRRLQGTIRALPRPGGGLIIAVQLPKASSGH